LAAINGGDGVERSYFTLRVAARDRCRLHSDCSSPPLIVAAIAALIVAIAASVEAIAVSVVAIVATIVATIVALIAAAMA
jgi:hypothetical protein